MSFGRREPIFQCQSSSSLSSLPRSLSRFVALSLPARLTFNETVDSGLVWTLPSETTKILHPYKVTWFLRVGKGVPSGTIVPIGVYVDDEWEVELQVLVK